MADVVMVSIEDAGGQRCVDLIRREAGDWAWVECRRDPEDGHGWRRLGDPVAGFAGMDAARAAAGVVGWIAEVGG